MEVVGRSFCCRLKVTLSFNEADVCKPEGRRSCLGAVSLRSLSRGLHLAALSAGRCIREFEGNSGLILRIRITS